MSTGKLETLLNVLLLSTYRYEHTNVGVSLMCLNMWANSTVFPDMSMLSMGTQMCDEHMHS